MTFVSPAIHGGALSTRTFIPHRCHKTIGVLGAVSVATAACMPGSVAYDIAQRGEGLIQEISIEHPSGEMTVIATLDQTGAVAQAAILRTARKLMDGTVFS
jgi:4-oxalomesaconate tautomerase